MGWRSPAPTVGYLELLPEAARARPAVDVPPAAVYVHFPFCHFLCTYCDFDTFAGKEALIEGYVDALLQQIRRSPRARATSLYVGGGTPSLMSVEQAAALVSACRETFDLLAEAEATLEANPSDLSVGLLEGYRRAGFNRLSLGVQSDDARLLRLLGRRHTPEDARDAVEAGRAAGFSNLSVDLMYGVPLQTLDSWCATLDTILEQGVEHVSCYMLSVETGTPLERGVMRGTLRLPEDDEAVAMYETARDRLAARGFERYEISNWARPGRQSAHNLTYWRNEAYLGIGAGAASFWQGRRYKILGEIEGYIEGICRGRVPLEEEENVDPRRSMSDSLILGLRLEEGVAREPFAQRHGVHPEDAFEEPLRWAMDLGLLRLDEDALKLTEKGLLVSNELLARLI